MTIYILIDVLASIPITRPLAVTDPNRNYVHTLDGFRRDLKDCADLRGGEKSDWLDHFMLFSNA